MVGLTRYIGMFAIAFLASILLLAVCWASIRGNFNVYELLVREQLLSGRFVTRVDYLIQCALLTAAFLPLVKTGPILTKLGFFCFYAVICAVLFVIDLQKPELMLYLYHRIPTREMWEAWSKAPLCGILILFGLSHLLPINSASSKASRVSLNAALAVLLLLTLIAALFFLPQLVGRRAFAAPFAYEFYVGLTQFLGFIFLLVLTVPMLVSGSHAKWAVSLAVVTAASSLTELTRSYDNSYLLLLMSGWIVLPLFAAVTYLLSSAISRENA
jgi:hypothetical protein